MTLRRGHLWLVYGLLVLVGALTIAYRTVCHYPAFTLRAANWRLGVLDRSKLGYVATHDLPRNHRFIDADLERPKLPASVAIDAPLVSGRYAPKAISKGTVVQLSRTRTSPAVGVRPSRTTITVPVSADLVKSGAVDAGTQAVVAFGNRTISAMVEAIVGANSDSAIVSVSKEDAQSFTNRGTTAAVLLPIQKGAPMDQKSWSQVTTIDVSPDNGPWVLAIDYVPSGTLLKFECKDAEKKSWKYAVNPEVTSGPDGNIAGKVATGETLPLATAPIGSLIAKIGGSTASSEGTIFSVGSFAVHLWAAAESGPLYLGMNVPVASQPKQTKTAISVTISEAKP